MILFVFLSMRFLLTFLLTLVLPSSSGTLMADQLMLPPSIVTKILKVALPDDVTTAGATRTMAAQAAGVFVLYLSSAATERARRAKRSTMTGDDVLAAAAELGLDSVLTGLNAYADITRDAAAAVKRARSAVTDGDDDDVLLGDAAADADDADDADADAHLLAEADADDDDVDATLPLDAFDAVLDEAIAGLQSNHRGGGGGGSGSGSDDEDEDEDDYDDDDAAGNGEHDDDQGGNMEAAEPDNGHRFSHGEEDG
jgi:DNA polymerase epsilon subunit 3